MAPVSPRKNNTATKQKRQKDADCSSEVDRRPLSPGKRNPEGGRQEPAPGQQPGEELEGQSSARSARSRRKEEGGFMHEGCRSESPQQHLTLGSQTPPLATPSQEPARFTAEEVLENRTGMRRKRNRVTAAEVNEHRLGGSPARSNAARRVDGARQPAAEAAASSHPKQGLFYHETSETNVSELFRYSGACGGGGSPWYLAQPPSMTAGLALWLF